MKYKKEECLDIGRKIYESGLSNIKAGKLFGISEESARRYRILYAASLGIEHCLIQPEKKLVNVTTSIILGEPMNCSVDYSSMSKEELIEELMKSRIREAHLKKGTMLQNCRHQKQG